MAQDAEIRTKPPCRREDALAVLTRLREAGHVAFFAGGCVRDVLLGLMPKDWDIATDAPPQRVRELFPKTQAVGAAFGVILVKQGKSQVEVATFRSEGPYLDGRRPARVHFATPEEDARRRDFTINGLFLDPLENDRIIDFIGGLEDLRARRLRAIGDPAERFSEDHLRLMRAVRFAARFGLEIEPLTSTAISIAAPLLKRISPERVADELRLALTPPTRTIAWELLWRFRLIDVVFRFMAAGAMPAFRPERSILLALAPAETIPFELALAAAVLCYQWQADGDLRMMLSRSAVQKAVRAMRLTLRISNDESDHMREILEGIEPLLSEEPPRIATMKRFLARPTASLARMLMEAVHRIGVFTDRIEWLRSQLQELTKTDVSPLPLITGDDLTAAGLIPGPIFRRILDDVYDAQLEGTLTTKEQALRLAISCIESS